MYTHEGVKGGTKEDSTTRKTTTLSTTHFNVGTQLIPEAHIFVTIPTTVPDERIATRKIVKKHKKKKKIKTTNHETPTQQIPTHQTQTNDDTNDKK